MKRFPRHIWIVCWAVLLALIAAVVAPTTTTLAQDKTLIVGFVLVGPQGDKGWSEAQFHAAEYVEQKIPGVKKLVLDKLNPADRPNVTLEQVIDNMVKQGATLIFTTSDDFGQDTLKVAQKYANITFIHVSGDAVLKGDAPQNVGNVMGRMEYMKMVAGCAAALTTQTKSIGYLGPLINDETRRLATSVYLGAKYCYQNYRKADPSELKFTVKWIGFWFNIPGVTLDPTEVANNFFNSGTDVLLSGIDTTEALVVTSQRADKGEKVFAVPYDYSKACDTAPKVCLGVPYFNWGPAYVRIVKDFQAGKWKQNWEWDAPDWKDINNSDNSAVGFTFGSILSADQKTTLQKFTAGLGDGSINLFKGPLKFQDGSVYLKDGQTATDPQIWYLPQLLEGMTGDSTPPSNPAATAAPTAAAK